MFRMALIRMDIQSVVVGAGPVASVVVLKPRHGDSGAKLPIRIGTFEAASISMGVDGRRQKRPTTHDLLQNVISELGASVTSVVINNVRDTTFFAQVRMRNAQGESLSIDARPSDALAIAVRAHAPVFAESDVLSAATLPDFSSVERDQREQEAQAFHDFVEGLSPDDFS